MFHEELHTDDPWIDPRLASELDPGERVVWAVRPIPSEVARQARPTVLFAIPWTAFAMFWTIGALTGVVSGSFGNNSGTGGITGQVLAYAFPLFGLPFVLVGVWMLTTPQRLKRLARRSLYVLTDRRCIVWKQLSARKVEVSSYAPARIVGLRREQRPDGSGSLIFDLGKAAPSADETDSVSTDRSGEEGFLCIPDVAEVERLVRQTLGLER